MKIGIIDIGWKEIRPDTFSSSVLGGSETWLMRVTQELVAAGHEVDLYVNAKTGWTDGKIKFIPLYNIIDQFLLLPRYDFMILNRIYRRFNTDIVTLIRQYNVTDNIFLQMHDLSLMNDDGIATDKDVANSGLLDPRVRGIVFLTEWHKKNFEGQYPSLNSVPKYIIPNGIDTYTMPEKKPNKLDHRILWSSCAERGLDILIDMYDEIKAQIPDFGIDVAGYNDLSNVNTKGKDVKILGNLSKEQLYKEMNKHSVWFYPGTFAETFCITMIENTALGNTVVSPFTFGTSDVLSDEYKEKTWSLYGRPDIFKTDGTNYSSAIDKAAQCVIAALRNRDESLIEQGKNEVKKYTWQNTVDKYIKLYRRIIYDDIAVKHRYKGIFLSQSANHEFFKNESKVVEETWAKDLIDGKYPGYCYFRYTSCDNDHPKPCIDGTTIYVSNEDTLTSTYTKMRDAYRLLLSEGYSFGYIFRTNTSTYVNVKKAVEAIENTKINEIKSDICGYYHLMPTGDRVFQFNCFVGNAYIMSKPVADRIFLSRYDDSISPIKDGDDIISNMILNELVVPGEVIMSILNPGKEHLDMCYRYKHIINKDNLKDYETSKRYTEDPNVVNQFVTTSVRILDVDFETRVKAGEYDHMRELHQAYVKAL